jgi:hypothetical protein
MHKGVGVCVCVCVCVRGGTGIRVYHAEQIETLVEIAVCDGY